MPVFAAPDGVQLFLKSPTGETLTILADSDRSGILLNAKVKTVKQGGVEEFTFDLPKTFDLPITRNTQCHFYVNNTLWFIGLVKEIPLPDQDEPVLTIVGEGFYKRLDNKIITATYTAQTLDTIVKGIASAELGADVGVFYDVAKIDVPVLSGLDVQYKDTSLLKVMMELIQAANYDYSNDKYRFYVDNEAELVFEHLPNTTRKGLFEGFQYQRPDVSEDNSQMVNRIVVFRTQSGSPKNTEYVLTVDQLDSQSRYGLFEKKLTFANYLNATILNSIVNGIFDRRALPTVKIEISDYEIEAPVDYGEYLVSNRRRPYRFLVNDCDSLTGWDVSNLSITTVAIDDTRVLTGRQSIEVTVADGSSGEYMEYELPEPIPFPKKGRVFLYFTAITPAISITFYSVDGNEITIQLGQLDTLLQADTGVLFDQQIEADVPPTEDIEVTILNGSIIDQWVRLEEDIEFITQLEAFQVDDGGGLEDLEVIYATGPLTDTFSISEVQQEGILDIKKVRITILSNAAAVFYIDRIDALAEIFNSRRLQLEEAEYILSAVGLFANLSFGERADSVFTEINNKIEDGDIALSIASKQ